MNARLPLSCCLAAAVAAALASGCGGSSTLSKSELAKKADAICREGRVSYARELGPNPNFPAAIAVFDAGILRINKPLDRRIADLKPPKSEAATWKAYLATRRDVTALAQREERAARTGNNRDLQAVNRDRQALVAKRGRLAKKLGLRVCGNTQDIPNLLGSPEPAGPPPKSVHYVKPKNTLDQALAAFRAAKTCDALRALQNSDDPKLKTQECQGLLPALTGFRLIAKDAIGPVGLVDFTSQGRNGTVLFAEDGKDGRLRLATVIANEGGAIHKPTSENDAAGNMANVVIAIRDGNGAALHAAISENSSLYTEPPSKVAKLKNPTGSGPRLVSDLKADPKAKPQTLAIDATFGFFTLRANGHNYLLFNLKGPTGYKFEGSYPQPAG